MEITRFVFEWLAGKIVSFYGRKFSFTATRQQIIQSQTCYPLIRLPVARFSAVNADAVYK